MLKSLFKELITEPIKANRQSYEIIDPHIIPLVECLNAIEGIETVASCQGHLFSIHPAQPPYVYFKSNADIAKRLHQCINEYNLTKEDQLSYWYIKGRFNGDDELCFSLSSETYEANYNRSVVLGNIIALGLKRQRANQEIVALAQFIARYEAARLNGKATH